MRWCMRTLGVYLLERMVIACPRELVLRSWGIGWVRCVLLEA